MTRPQRERIEAIDAFGRRFQLVEGSAGFGGDAEVSGVDIADTIHARHNNHHGTTRRVWCGSTTQAGVATLRDDGRICGDTKTHDFGDLCRTFWQDHGERASMITIAPVIQIRRLRSRIGENLISAEASLQLRDQGLVHVS